MKIVSLLTVLLIVMADGAIANQQELQKVKANLEAAKTEAEKLNQKSSGLSEELEDLQERIVSASKKVQASEERLSKVEAELAAITLEEGAKNSKLAEQQKNLSKTISAMTSLSMTPPEAVIAMPGDPEDIARASWILSSLTESLKDQAEELKLDILEIQSLKADIAERKEKQKRESERLKKDREVIQTQIAERSKLRQQISSDLASRQREVAELSRRSQNMEQLIARLEQADKARPITPAPSAPLAAPKPSAVKSPPPASGGVIGAGNFRMPASGSVVSTFGQRMKNGATSKGISMKTRDNAVVTSPTNGEVVFVGPFMGYGKLVIVRHAEGYHSLLSGLREINVGVGQRVNKGEFVGNMGSVKDNLTTLYLEVRKNNRPVNPSGWLEASAR
jgi:septal ring factor EnvC (AmiA/AmiB activator)